MSWIAAGLIAVIVPLAIGALSKASKVPAEIREGKKWLTYGSAFKIFTTVGFVIPWAISILFFYVETKDITIIAMMVALFAVLTIPLFLEAFFVKIGFDDNMVYCFSPWRPNRKIGFSDIGEPKYSDKLQWWVIPTTHQGNIRVQDFISGKEDFLNKIEEQRLGRYKSNNRRSKTAH